MKRLGAPYTASPCPFRQQGPIAFFLSRKSKIAVLPIDCRQGHLVFELSSPSRVEGRSSPASIRSRGLRICLFLSHLGGLPRTAHVEPAGTSSDAGALAGVFPLRSSLTVLLPLSISTRVVTEYAELRAMP